MRSSAREGLCEGCAGCERFCGKVRFDYGQYRPSSEPSPQSSLRLQSRSTATDLPFAHRYSVCPGLQFASSNPIGQSGCPSQDIELNTCV